MRQERRTGSASTTHNAAWTHNVPAGTAGADGVASDAVVGGAGVVVVVALAVDEREILGDMFLNAGGGSYTIEHVS